MRRCFADTGFFIALINSADTHHATAQNWRRVIREQSGQIITSEFCLLELVDAFSGVGNRELGRRVIGVLRRSPDARIIECSPELFQAGLELHADRDDKSWSLTDCTSLVIMDREGLQEVLAFDRHFRQAGKQVLPLDFPVQ